jgi:hypothetical protein
MVSDANFTSSLVGIIDVLFRNDMKKFVAKVDLIM